MLNSVIFIPSLDTNMKKSLLVTGGCGFIGANFILNFLQNHPDYYVVNLDCLSYAAQEANLASIRDHSNYTFVRGNICDEALVNRLFQEHAFSGVINFAAESHVDNSISGPGVFIESNIRGTFVLLEACRKHWLDGPHSPKPGLQNNRFHQISTDEVYGSLGETGLFTEETPYAPNSPYSASKASADMLVRSYHHTFGLNTTISNCSNNYGPFQHDEKLIPTIIRNALSGNAIPIYGDGKNVRDWLYVTDHCSAIELIYFSAKAGTTYNVGGSNELNNNQIASQICQILDEVKPRSDRQSYATQLKFVADRPGHDRRYAIDSTKISTELNWTPKLNFSDALLNTIRWYLQKYA